MPSRRVAGDTVRYPGVIRAQVTFNSTSGLPRDRFVNTFHFLAPANQTTYDGISTLLHDFYTHAYGQRSLATWLSPRITYPELKMYDLAEPDPREPHTPTDPSTFRSAWDFRTSQAMPDEVAVCLSYYAGRNVPRQRGRVYFGPLNVDALVQPGGAGVPGDATVSPELQSALSSAGFGLAHQLAFAGVSWCILSPKHGGANGAVTAGWVDNTFDTMRKRGVRPTSRQNWGT